MKTEDIPQTKLEAIRYFADEQRAHDFLVWMRWPEGVRCAHCASENIGKLSIAERIDSKGRKAVRRVWNCKACKRQFTVKLGTIFQDSALPLSTWLPAVWMVVNSKNGVSSCELARDLGITQKNAWHLSHRIRAAMHEGIFDMDGECEADETFVGGSARFMHAARKNQTKKGGTGHLTVVAGILERPVEGRTSSRVKAKVINSPTRAVLLKNIRETVKPGALICTDALPSYRTLSEDYFHGVVDHAVSYVEDTVHTNGLENFWSLLKRSLKGTYVCPAPFHLFRYLDEQATRFNERKGTDSERFLNTMRRTPGKRLTFKKLTGKDGERC